jgi:hypothetical protein
MDLQQYHNLTWYLTNFSFLEGLNKQQQKQLQQKAKQFFIRDDKLWHKHQPLPQRVITTKEVEAILYGAHADITAGHFAKDATYQRIIEKYFWPKMAKDIEQYVKTCDICQHRGGRKAHEQLHPIKVGQPFDRVGIDVVGPLPITTKGNRYIVVASDYLTKWPEARATQDQTAPTIANFVYEDIICRHGCPTELLSDQGPSFRSELMEEFCNIMEIRHKLSSPYHPQTNGLVERFNRTLCESLAKYVHAFGQEWDLYIPSVLLAYRTIKHNTTKFDPFYLLYGRTAILPMETHVATYPYQEINQDNFQETLMRRIYSLIDDLHEVQNQAKRNISKSQEYQKQHHDQQIIPKVFNIGDKVLMYRMQLEKQYSGKFEQKWKGPYYVHATFGNGAYKLRTMDGKVLKTSIHGNQLKLYFNRPSWEPMVIIS